MDTSHTIVDLLGKDLAGLDLGLLHDLPGGPSQWAGLFMSQGDVQEMRALLQNPPLRDSDTAVVFLPGIMGSLLSSTRGIGGLLWLNGTVLVDGRVNLLELDESGEQDASSDVSVVATGIEKSTYVQAVVRLSRACCLYEFPYDWRKRLQTVAAELAECLQRWAVARPSQRFTLLGHSMGGMVARTFVAMYPALAERLVERVVLLGSPIHGAASVPQIFAGETTQARLIERLNPDNDITGMCCGFPSCYQLLPPPPELFPAGRRYPFDWDIYDASCWRVRGVRQDLLNEAAAYHRMHHESDPQVEIWQFAGCNIKTIVGLSRIDAAEGETQLETISASVGESGGDGTVPLWSAHSKAVQHMHYVQTAHHSLPADKDVLDDVERLLVGEKPQLPSVVPLPKLDKRESLQVPNFASMATEMAQRIRRGELSALDRRNLLFRGDDGE